MKNKQLVINIISNIFAYGVSIGISFFLTPYLIRTVGKEAYSFFPLANDFVQYVNIVALALNSMAGRFITIKIHEENNEDANKYFNSVFIGNIMLALVLVVLSAIFVIFMNNILQIPSELLKSVQLLFSLIFVGMIINIVTCIFGVSIFVKNRLDISSVRNIVSNVIQGIILVVLFVLFEPTVIFIGIANFAVVIFVSAVNLYYLKKLLPQIKISKVYFDLKKIKELLASGIWNSLNQLSAVLLSGLNLLISNVLLSSSAAGEYSIIRTVPHFIQSLITVLASVFVPQFTILYAKKKKKELFNNINSSIKFMGIMISIPISFLMIYGENFFSLWVPGEDVKLLSMLSTLTIIPMIITCSVYTLTDVFTVTNKLRKPAIGLFIIGVINVLGVVTLIKVTDLGINAIPIVALVVQIAYYLIFVPIYAAKCLNLNYSYFYSNIAKTILSAVIMCAWCLLIKNTLVADTWIKLIMSGALTSMLTLISDFFVVISKGDREYIRKYVRRIAGSRLKKLRA